MLQEFGNALSFIVLAAILPAAILFLSRFFRPSYPHSGKLTAYECGEDPTGLAYVMYNNRFYLVAIVFLVFDVEIALLFPVLRLFKSSLGTPESLPIFLLSFGFLFVLFIGLIYEWKKGDIDWVRDFIERKKALEDEEHFQHRMGKGNS
jgi:NADH-quinone oxidoreductase subunit A